MATDPLRYRVMQNVQTTLAAIAERDGYHYTIPPGSVYLEPVDLLQQPSSKLPVLIVAPDDRQTERVFLQQRIRSVFRMLITGIVEAEGSDPGRKLAAAERLYSDIEKALRVDLSRGGLTSATRVFEPDPPFLGLGSQLRVIIQQPIDCWIQRDYGSP